MEEAVKDDDDDNDEKGGGGSGGGAAAARRRRGGGQTERADGRRGRGQTEREGSTPQRRPLRLQAVWVGCDARSRDEGRGSSRKHEGRQRDGPCLCESLLGWRGCCARANPRAVETSGREVRIIGASVMIRPAVIHHGQRGLRIGGALRQPWCMPCARRNLTFYSVKIGSHPSQMGGGSCFHANHCDTS